jgi:hypothetical protein
VIVQILVGLILVVGMLNSVKHFVDVRRSVVARVTEEFGDEFEPSTIHKMTTAVMVVFALQPVALAVLLWFGGFWG